MLNIAYLKHRCCYVVLLHRSVGFLTQDKETNKLSYYIHFSFTKQFAASLRSHNLVLFKSGEKQKYEKLKERKNKNKTRCHHITPTAFFFIISCQIMELSSEPS